jgi:hypothetical protein
MPSYRGRFQYQAASGAATQQGACQIQFDEEKFTLAPESGAAIVFDLGDIDAVNVADYEIRLPLYTGNAIVLQQFGKSYQDLARELLEDYRKRTLECLLLEDLQELDRFTGGFTLELAGSAPVAGPAEVRLFKSNLAVLPTASQAFQWRLADVTGFRFDAQNYEIVLDRDGDRLRLNRLAKRTDLLQNKLREALDALHAEGGKALHGILPFLNPDQLQHALELLPEGHSAATARLAAVHPRIPDALAANAVDKMLKPYFDELRRRACKDLLFAGYKLIRPEDGGSVANSSLLAEEDASGEEDAATGSEAEMSDADADADAPQVLYWFFFPMAAKGGSAPNNVVAWEASSQSGRATYFFRLTEAGEEGLGNATAAIEQGVARITRVLGLVNFRRRPIYLSDSDLTGKAKFHRYAIAARKIADLRAVRAAFLGRAIHSSLEAWRDQVDGILSKAGV